MNPEREPLLAVRSGPHCRGMLAGSVGPMHCSARVDYALQALAELAGGDGEHLKAEQLATAQGIPLRFLENILLELKHRDLVTTHRGSAGGYALALRPSEITIADVIRAIDGPLANIKGERPETVTY